MWETHSNDCWVFSKMADLLSLIPWSSTFQDGGWVKQRDGRGLNPGPPDLEFKVFKPLFMATHSSFMLSAN